MPRFVRHGFGLVFLSAAVLLTGGCARGPTICRVTGTVRHNGKPVPNITVCFVPDEGRESIGTTDEAGAFKLTYEKTKEGAARGKHKVFFVYRPKTPKEEMDVHAGKASLPPDVKAVLAKYGSRDTSPLSYEVTTDDQIIDITLD